MLSLLKRIFWPVTLTVFLLRLSFRLLFWWVFALFGILLSWNALSDLPRYMTDTEQRAAALRAGPPSAVQLEDFDRLRDVHMDQEVHILAVPISGQSPKFLDLPVSEISYLPLAVSEGGPVGAVIATFGSRPDRLVAYLQSRTIENGQAVLINGTLTVSTTEGLFVRDDLISRGFDVTQEVLVIRPFRDDRATALQTRTIVDLGLLVARAVIAAILLLTAFIKYRRWRNRSREQNRPISAQEESIAPASPWTRPTVNEISKKAASDAPWGARPTTAPAAALPQQVPKSPELITPTKTVDEIILRTFGSSARRLKLKASEDVGQNS